MTVPKKTPALPKDRPMYLGHALELVHEKLAAADVFFGHGTDNPWDEAVQLVLAAFGLPADSGDDVLQRPTTEAAWQQMRDWVGQRITQRTPLAYLTGSAWFAGLEFLCDPRALVPRSPLAEIILNDFQPWWSLGDTRAPRLLDLCCGGGAIGIASAVHHPSFSVTLSDVDARALALARENIQKHDVQSRVTVCQGDGFAALGGETFDVILCNPPYVNAQDLAAMPAEYHAEPPLGLGSGEDGLDLPRRLLATASEHLSSTGVMFMELGNSWEALDHQLAAYPLSWLEFADGGHGVLMLDAKDLAQIAGALP